jgi:hypothetical protein
VLQEQLNLFMETGRNSINGRLSASGRTLTNSVVADAGSYDICKAVRSGSDRTGDGDGIC